MDAVMQQDLSDKFKKATGCRHYLSADDHTGMEDYLREQEFLIPGEEVIALMPAGEGNMNVTLRVLTSRRRIIVKQSRPWVARFPDLKAPIARILVERQFYQAVARNRYLSGHMPELLRSDAKNFVLILEDLGPVSDLSNVYSRGTSLGRKQLKTLLHYAGELHTQRPTGFPDNRALKQLNHAHIFDLPFRPDNGFPLEAIHPGLAAVALPYQHDRVLRREITRLGRIYLAQGDHLIHGDYHPGSFVQVDDRIFVIDTEFAHLGRPEFDIGVLMGHLLMTKATEGRIQQIDLDYRKPPGFDVALTRKFCYVEIMRRIIGIAQLPLSLSLDERKHLLERARVGLL